MQIYVWNRFSIENKGKLIHFLFNLKLLIKTNLCAGNKNNYKGKERRKLKDKKKKILIYLN